MKKFIGNILCALYQFGLDVCQASYRLFPFRIHKVNARVISVGNITWGGTGKTPLVIKLAHDLSHYGKRVVVLTRGYGMDEVEELKSRLGSIPVIVGRDRVKSALEAVKKFNAEYILLDDGFQHLRLHRDLDVVTINSTIPFGPGGLIPMGTLREPMERLSRADIFVLTKSNLGSKNLHWIRQRLGSIKPNPIIFEALHRPTRLWDPIANRTVSLDELRGKRVSSLCGIADPYSFEKTVERLGAQIVFAARFDDHHDYTTSEMDEFVARTKESGATFVVTTQKDYYRLAPILKRKDLFTASGLSLRVLQIEFKIADDEENFIRRCLNT